ncbi:MAG: LysR family transcriptional regulator [Nannocystaceae bacterium]|nr:LysR family transcriptional regulator [Nannocystaceae bacterium]
MEIYQLKTFVAVASKGSVTRAAEALHLSQPAVSAHVKVLEETLGVALFTRVPAGMKLTGEGEQLIAKAEKILDAHQELFEEANRIKKRVNGRLRLGVCANTDAKFVGEMLQRLSRRWPELELSIKQGDSTDVVDGILKGSLDGGFFNDAARVKPELSLTEVSRFGIYLVACPGLARRGDWKALEALPWVCPNSDTCCGRAAEALFQRHGIRPKRIISVDREFVTRTLVAAGVGVGLLHEYTATEAQRNGEVEILEEALSTVQVQFGRLSSRDADPKIVAAVAALTQ